MTDKIHRYTPIVLAFISVFTLACDPQRKAKCEWYFTPFPQGNHAMKEGWVSICASNFKLGKQKCYFTAKPDFLEKMNGVPFKFTSLKYSQTFPKRVLSVKPCSRE